MLHTSARECCRWEYLSVHIIFSQVDIKDEYLIDELLMNALLGVMNSSLILTILLVTLNRP